jgi:hypothetical protein
VVKEHVSPCAALQGQGLQAALALSASMERPTTMARHSRLYSSITFKSFRILLSDVWSNWKSSAQMTFGAIGHMSPNQHLDVTEREFHLTE